MNDNNFQDQNLPTEVLPTEAALNQQTETSLPTEDPIRQKLEERIIRSTKGFFRSLNINLAFLSYFNIISIAAILNIIQFKYGILSLVPIEIIQIFTQYARMKKALEGNKSRKKILGNLLVNSEFLDSLSRCFASLLFFLAGIIPSFTYSLCFGPIAVCSLVVIIVNVIKCCKVNI